MFQAMPATGKRTTFGLGVGSGQQQEQQQAQQARGQQEACGGSDGYKVGGNSYINNNNSSNKSNKSNNNNNNNNSNNSEEEKVESNKVNASNQDTSERREAHHSGGGTVYHENGRDFGQNTELMMESKASEEQIRDKLEHIANGGASPTAMTGLHNASGSLANAGNLQHRNQFSLHNSNNIGCNGSHNSKTRDSFDKENAASAYNCSSIRNRNSNNSPHSVANDVYAEVARLKSALEIAQHEAKLAAEIGQELLKQEQESKEEARDLAGEVQQQREQIGRLSEHLAEARKEIARTKDALDESRAECKVLDDRAAGLAQKLETFNREALRDGASFTQLEQRIRELIEERDEANLRVQALEQEKNQAELALLTSPLSPPTRKTLRGASHGDGGLLSPGFKEKPSKELSEEEKLAAIRHFQHLDEVMEAAADNSDSEYEDDDSYGTGSVSSPNSFRTPKNNRNMNRLRETLSAVREENAWSKKKIKSLEEALQRHTLDSQMSAHKVTSLEQDLNEFQEIARARTEVAEGGLFGNDEEDDAACEGISSLEAAILRDEMERLKDELRQANVLAIIRGEDLDETIEQLRQIQEERAKSKETVPTVIKIKRKRAKAYATVDKGCGPNEPINLDDVDLAEANQGSGKEMVVTRPPLDAHSGQLLVKQFRRRNIVGIAPSRSWKARVVQLHGSMLLLFRNEWDRRPCGRIPIDGTEVRVVRRPHLTGSGGVVSSPRETLRKQTGAARGAAIARSTCIVHEFHIWHARRPAVLFSAESHIEMSRWTEALQQHCSDVAMRPRRYAAGYLTIMESALLSDATKGNVEWTRYFAVLRADGLYFYTHPRKHKAAHVILLDQHIRLWKPTTAKKLSNMLEDIDRLFCITSPELGECSLLADTDVDRDWWLSSIRVHRMGIVSVGSVQGMRGVVPFGCVEV